MPKFDVGTVVNRIALKNLRLQNNYVQNTNKIKYLAAVLVNLAVINSYS